MKEIISSIKNFPKHVGTAFFNLFRNGTMTIYSLLAVTVTLALAGAVLVVASNINKMTENIEGSLSIYVKLEREISEEDELLVGEQIKAIEGVNSVTYSSKEEELQSLIEYFGEDGEGLFDDYHGDQNRLASAYSVEVEDANELETITKQISDLPNVNKANYGGSSTATLVNILEKVKNVGLISVIGLVVVVILVISSTIHITINNRKSEVEIMRMVGASNWYIRIPFMLEGAMIGLLGAIIPIVIIYFGYNEIYAALKGQLMANMLTLVKPDTIHYVYFTLGGIGVLVGLFGSGFAVSKYLKK